MEFPPAKKAKKKSGIGMGGISTYRLPDGNRGRWTDDETTQFEEALEIFGQDWKRIHALIPSRTLLQIRTHAQKFFKRRAKSEQQNQPLEQSGATQARCEKADGHASVSSGSSAAANAGAAATSAVPAAASLPLPPSTALRAGRWSTAEEAYARALVADFGGGTLEGAEAVPEGRMLRLHLAELLRCDPMRVSKKFVGNAAIGKQGYRRDQTAITERARSGEGAARAAELARLRAAFLACCAPTQVEQKANVATVKGAARGGVEGTADGAGTTSGAQSMDVLTAIASAHFSAPVARRTSVRLHGGSALCWLTTTKLAGGDAAAAPAPADKTPHVEVMEGH